MMKSKTIFMCMLIMGVILTVSSNNWMSMWMGLELNMIAFLPMLKLSKDKKSSNASMIYFLTQSMSSMILMFSMMSMMHGNYFSENLILLSLMIKLGSAPFHMWMPEMMSMINWNSCIMLLTVQKIAPLHMIYNGSWNDLINITIIMSTLIGALGGLNQTSLKKIMAYSSISHLAWMLMLNKNINKFYMYLIVYSIMITVLCTYFKINNLNFMNNLFSINIPTPSKINLTLMMMSVGGLPPLLGFLPKWMVIQTLMTDNNYIMMLILTTSTLITLFFYLRMINKMFMLFSTASPWILLKKMDIIPFIINMMLPIIFIIN
uniref:NADH dehydrogenase subunit 2 n=1 Tax=Bannacoris arboreus TaxID=1837149 RepID=UPI0024115B23|nr:NADH dehydrogenase subunit 2 [Bannacoris arboreus]WEM32387.1 NADH dehydrogenase subunit 2 [Bannacoris arboreus]